MFWLARAKRGGPSSSSRILRFMSWVAARAPFIPKVSNLSLEFSTLLFYLEVRLLELLLPLPQLLKPHGLWGLVSLPSPIFRDAWGSFHVVGVFEGWWLPPLELELEIAFDSPARRSWKDSKM
jgi:hypothetical protein